MTITSHAMSNRGRWLLATIVAGIVLLGVAASFVTAHVAASVAYQHAQDDMTGRLPLPEPKSLPASLRTPPRPMPQPDPGPLLFVEYGGQVIPSYMMVDPSRGVWQTLVLTDADAEKLSVLKECVVYSAVLTDHQTLKHVEPTSFYDGSGKNSRDCRE